MNTPTEKNGGNGHHPVSLPVEVRPRLASVTDRPGPPSFGLLWKRCLDRDLIPRRRTKQGDREAYRFASAVPTIDAQPLESTPLSRTIRKVEERFPVLASLLHHEYDHRLRAAGDRLRAVREEVDGRAAVLSAQGKADNAGIEQAQSEIRRERDEATASDRARLKELDGPLAEAHAAAATSVSAAGGVYDPANPDASSVLRDTAADIETLAGEACLPYTFSGHSPHPATWLSWFLTAVVGALVGVSVGIITHSLHSDTLTRHWPETLVWVGLGFGMSAAVRYAVRYLWFLVGQYSYLQGLQRRCWGLAATASAILAALALADMAVERRGLLALLQADQGLASLSGTAAQPQGDSWSLWFVAMIVSAGYLLCAAAEGYVRGRQASVSALLLARQRRELAAADAARRALPEVRAALQAIASVLEVQRQRSGLDARIAQEAAPYDGRIAELEGRRVPENVQPDLGDRMRVQDAADDFTGAQMRFDARLEGAVRLADKRRGTN